MPLYQKAQTIVSLVINNDVTLLDSGITICMTFYGHILNNLLVNHVCKWWKFYCTFNYEISQKVIILALHYKVHSVPVIRTVRLMGTPLPNSLSGLPLTGTECMPISRSIFHAETIYFFRPVYLGRKLSICSPRRVRQRQLQHVCTAQAHLAWNTGRFAGTLTDQGCSNSIASRT